MTPKPLPSIIRKPRRPADKKPLTKRQKRLREIEANRWKNTLLYLVGLEPRCTV